jgi:hypothetical protein
MFAETDPAAARPGPAPVVRRPARFPKGLRSPRAGLPALLAGVLLLPGCGGPAMAPVKGRVT